MRGRRGLQHTLRGRLFLFLFIRAAPPLCHSCHFGFVPFAETKPETRDSQGADRTTVTRQDSEGDSVTASRPALFVLSSYPPSHLNQSAIRELVSHEERFADTERGLRRIIGKSRIIPLNMLTQCEQLPNVT